MATTEQVMQALRRVIDPELGRDIVSLGMVRDVRVEGDRVSLTAEKRAAPVGVVTRPLNGVVGGSSSSDFSY
jgi:metal-sulfur cluster biosynthetic enzyme